MDFMTFIASLATNALAAMGALKDAGDLPANPQLAREYIDIIGMLEEKTQGNLSESEADGLKRILSELRMQYVNFTQGA